jgi:oligoribonuclease
MRYVSIDIETTGLNPKKCQLIELAAVIDDLRVQEPLDKLPKFVAQVWRPMYKGEPYALQMHANFFKKIATRDPSLNTMLENEVMDSLRIFLKKNGYNDKQGINVAGKNFASFDKRFIERLPKNDEVKFHHRVLDPAMLYFNPCEDDALPDTKKCLERAGLSGEVPHTALEDALLVVKLIRHKFPKG